MTRGFSLVELSIVLVVLGLLTGGILAGQSLIRAAELRAVSVEYQRYATAMQTFRDKYFAIPGDFAKATSFWGNASTGTAGGDCTDNTTATGSGTQTCNGNGDGLTALSNERLRFWQHMANAGLVEGSYTGIGGPGGLNHGVIGTNIPRSRLTSAGWTMNTYGSGAYMTGNTNVFDGTYINILLMGATTSNAETTAAAVKAEEAWNLDTKMDDAMPAIGSVRPRVRLDCTNVTAAVADSARKDATYNVTNSALACAIVFGVQ